MPDAIFIANATYQHRRFQYRVPRKGGAERLLEIPQGEQREIPRPISDADFADLIDQIHRVGGVPANDPQAIKRPHSLVYFVGPKPIKGDQIDEARERDIEARQELSGDMLQGLGLGLLGIQETMLKRHGADAGKLQETGLKIRQLADKQQVEPEENGVDAEFISSKKQSGRGRRRPQ